MRATPILSVLALWAALCAPAAAALNVFACVPEWAALAQELAGERASVFAATSALQDPHRIEARPSLIARTRAANLIVCTGGGLESGWLPQLLAQAGNGKVQPGTPGYFEVAPLVSRLEVPAVVDRAEGDIHPGGNPHIHLDPRNIARVAEALAERLAQIDPAGAPQYRARHSSFRTRWQAASARWEQQAARLKGVSVVVYHKDMSYLLHWLGMREAGSLEPKPGLPPSPGHLAELVERMKRTPARVIVYSAYASAKPAEFLAERTHIPVVMLPFTVGGTPAAADLFGLFDDTLARLLGAVK